MEGASTDDIATGDDGVEGVVGPLLVSASIGLVEDRGEADGAAAGAGVTVDVSVTITGDTAVG